MTALLPGIGTRHEDCRHILRCLDVFLADRAARKRNVTRQGHCPAGCAQYVSIRRKVPVGGVSTNGDGVRMGGEG